ncbi:MAG: cobalt-precorrin 5A hydrolase [Eubacteriales bacterium]|nr:cobalt-precorrin 5A hydrolase [Eubacteriales bacterium]
MSRNGKKYLSVAWCTPGGEALAQRLARKLQEVDSDYIPQFRKEKESLWEWAKGAFSLHQPLLFIGATGIALRTIAPLAVDKLTDSPVLVMEESGHYVIPLLSGHMGGANALARELAEILGATPVITTATDVKGLFSIDDFARRNGLRIGNREGIRRVSGKLLCGKSIGLRPNLNARFLRPQPEEVKLLSDADRVKADVVITHNPEMTGPLYLIPRDLVLGMGCRKDVPFEKLQEFLLQTLADNGLDEANIRCLASIDRKAQEPGLMMLAQYLGVPFRVYTAEELQQASGHEFQESPFVRENVGVGNVCERAAFLASAKGAPVLPKTKGEGMTLSIYRQENWNLEW